MNAAVLKTVKPARASGVRIPPSPLFFVNNDGVVVAYGRPPTTTAVNFGVGFEADPSATGSSEGGRLRRRPATAGWGRRNPSLSVVSNKQRPDREGSKKTFCGQAAGFEGGERRILKRSSSRTSGMPKAKGFWPPSPFYLSKTTVPSRLKEGLVRQMSQASGRIRTF